MFARRVPLLLLVFALHAGLWGLVRQAAPWPERTPAADPRPPLQVRPIALPQPPALLQTPRWWMPRAPTAPVPRWPEPELAAPAPQAITPPMAVAPTPAPAAAPASAPALDLRLPRGLTASPSARQPALDDPRSNSARPSTVESRIADALADRPLTEEPMGEGRTRIRKGQGCVEVHDPRIAAIDPFNESVRPSPKQALACR